MGVIGDTPNSTFTSIVNFALHLARKFQLLRNDRTILLKDEDRFQKLNLILCAKNKETYGSFESDISDVLDLARITSETSNLDESEACQSYRRFIQSSNLVDSHTLYNILKKSIAEPDSELKSYLQSMPYHLMIWNPYFGPKSLEMDFLKLFCPEGPHLQFVQVETSLDSSLKEGSSPEFQIRVNALEDVPELDLEGMFRPYSRSESVDYCLAWMEGILRLLVNSRDELALARIMSGPFGILGQTAFTVIKHQAQSINMPLYQTIISYVGKLKLGGKSYAPCTDHPFYPYNKELCQFESLMDKLHSMVEEIKTGRALTTKLVQALRSFAQKIEKLKTSRLDTATEICLDVLNASLQLKDDIQLGATPKREVGKGGSVVGRQNMKIIRAAVDSLSTRSRVIKVHVLLGKIAHKPVSQSNSVKGTPIQIPSLVQLFTSPEEIPEEAPKDDTDTQDNTTNDFTPAKKPSAKGHPKYGSTFAWAPETSPLLIGSAELVSMAGQTLACPAPGDTPLRSDNKRKLAEAVAETLIQDVEVCLQGGKLAKARAEGEKAFKRMREDKTSRRRVAKRSILKDIANMKTPTILEKPEHNFGSSSSDSVDLKSRPGIISTKENPLSQSIPKKSKPLRKKGVPPPLLHGQTKLTTYFRI
eukprot:TCALIF_03704-PA protein Name:"Similar to parpbp PCNA-interacting partner (Xenopus tropicalis)" AED:0.06 eAED:0.06 QI:0/0.75/0.6/1/1/1/5/0/645